jgi:hypothetical protein
MLADVRVVTIAIVCAVPLLATPKNAAKTMSLSSGVPKIPVVCSISICENSSTHLSNELQQCSVTSRELSTVLA